MAATPSHRQLTVAERPGVLANTFWELAGDAPDTSDPIAVARAAADALGALERTHDAPKVTAATLTFLLRLEGDRIYAAPEQARGDATNQRSLVFTVGVLMFEKLTGQHPFGMTTRGTSVATADERIPPELRAALDIAMAPFPADRWSSLRALRDELERIVDRERSLVVEMKRTRRRSVPPPCPGSAVRRFARGSRPAPIPGAPALADAHDEEELVLERPVSREPATARAAHADTVAASTASTAPTASTVEASAAPRLESADAQWVDLALLESKPWHSLARALVLMTVGAGLALTAVWLVQRPIDGVAASSAREPAPAAAAAVELPGIVVDVSRPAVEEAPPVELSADEAAAAVAAPAPTLEVEPAVATVAAEPGPLDPDRAGEAALAALSQCFDDARLRRGVELSASVRFSRDDGRSDRVYFAPAQVLTDAERGCVRERLTGLSAGAVPERHSIVSFTFWLGAQRTRFWAKLQQ